MNCAGQFSSFVVVRPDERTELDLCRSRRSRIDACIGDDDRDVRSGGFAQGRRHFLGTARRDAERFHPGLDQVLDNLRLLLDVQFPLGCLHDQVDTERARRLFGAAFHVEEERMVQRLHDEGDARATRRAVVGRLSVAAGVHRCHRQSGEDNHRSPEDSYKPS